MLLRRRVCSVLRRQANNRCKRQGRCTYFPGQRLLGQESPKVLVLSDQLVLVQQFSANNDGPETASCALSSHKTPTPCPAYMFVHAFAPMPRAKLATPKQDPR